MYTSFCQKDGEAIYPIDLRSDTVTRPSPAMRKAMAEAEVGDDVYGEDPTINRLEAVVAELLGFERALFVPSGTMANQIAVLLQARRGSEVILTEGAHLYEFEPGALAVLAGVLPRLIPALYGAPVAGAVTTAVHQNPHQAPSTLVALENTHNTAGGTVLPLSIQAQVQAEARQAHLPVHLDGARLWNAAVALGVEPKEVAHGFDTVSVCLSKGLGAPVGSLLAMPKVLLPEARRYRKLLGGGMRQAGVLAAAGLVALAEGYPLLLGTHQMARSLALGLVNMGLEIDLDAVQTNMVYLHIPGAAGLTGRLARVGVLAGAIGADKLRFVTHRDLEDGAVDEALVRMVPILSP